MKNMQKLISFSVVLAMCFSFLTVPSATAATVAEYTFSDYETGSKPPASDIRYLENGTVATIAAFPSEKNKSIMVQTQEGGYEFWMDLSVSGKRNFVAETAIAYQGTLSSYKRILLVMDSTGKNYIQFMTLKPSGELSLFDGRTLTKLSEGVMCKIALYIDFNNRTCDVKINGKTAAVDVKLNKDSFTEASRIRTQMHDITSGAEKFYINYVRGYEGTFGEEAEQEETTTGMPIAPQEIKITEKVVSDRMNGNVFMTTKAGKALVNNKVMAVDENNPDMKPTIINGRTLVPVRFVAEALGAKVSYDNETARIAYGNKTMLLKAGTAEYTVNNEGKQFDVAPLNKDGRILVPLRAISEEFDKEVFYDKCGYIIIGDNASSFTLENRTDKEILDRAVRDIIYESPSPEDVIKDLKATTPYRQHPRLLVTKDTLPALRDKALNDPTASEWMKSVLKEAEGYLDDELFKYGREDAYRMLTTARNAKMRISVLSFAYLITKEEKYAEKAAEFLMNVCGNDFPDWNPYHFLDPAEMATGVALGYDWLYDYLSDYEKSVIRVALMEKGLQMVLGDYNDNPEGARTWKYWSWDAAPAYPNNWSSVINGGMAMAALAIADESPEEGEIASQVISLGMEHLKDIMAGFAPDGAWYEGPTYWKYAYEYYAFAIECYLSALGTDYDLGNALGLHEGAYYFIAAHGPQGTFNISDAAQTVLNAHEIMWLSKYYKDPGLTQYRLMQMKNENLTPNYRDIIFYQPQYNSSDNQLRTDSLHRMLEVASSRISYDTSDLYVAFHGGDGEETHCHLDSGTFIIDLFNKRWALDLGSEPQNYHSGYRFDYYRSRAEGHNVLIFNPDVIDDQNKYAVAEINRFEHNSNTSIMVSDLSKVHEYKGAQKVIRGIKMDKINRSVLIQDEVVMKKPSEMYWFMHTFGDITVSDDGRSATIMYGTNKLQAQLIGPEELKFSVMQAVPLPTSPTPSNMADDSDKQKLVIHANNVTELDFAVRISPLCGNETATVTDEKLQKISAWALEDEKALPTLTEISVNGTVLEDFDPEKTMYTVTFDPYSVSDEEANPTISVKGNYDAEITQISHDNSCAKVIVSDGNEKRAYFINFIPADEAVNAKNYEIVNAEYTGDTSKLETIKPVSVYAEHVPQPQNNPENTIDGDMETRWSSDKSGTVIEYDLGEVKDIKYFGAAFMDGSKRHTMFRIAVSEDGERWKVVRNIKTAGTTENIEIYDLGEQKARYVRVIGYGNSQGSWFSPRELRIYAEKTAK